MGPLGLKPREDRAACLPEAPGRLPSCLFRRLEAAHIPWLLTGPCHPHLCSCCRIFSDWDPPPTFFQGPCDDSEPTRGGRDTLPISRALPQPHPQAPLCHARRPLPGCADLEMELSGRGEGAGDTITANVICPLLPKDPHLPHGKPGSRHPNPPTSQLRSAPTLLPHPPKQA